MKRPAKFGKDQVTLSRDEVKQLLQLAWGARDATQHPDRSGRVRFALQRGLGSEPRALSIGRNILNFI